jgi:DNA (cytosine-5)-methyltransferase 1
LADCEVVYGLDNNADAVATFQRNHLGAKSVKEDATNLTPENIPDFDILVGGPPCVNFSSSKGGRANVLEGLRLVQAFLRVVYERQPEYWIMENVPRVALHLPDTIPLSWIGIDKKGELAVPVRHEFNCADYGVPQSRKRYLIGNYPVPSGTHFDPADDSLFRWGGSRQPWKTLADVLQCLPEPDALTEGTVTDPNYGFTIPTSKLADHFHPVVLEPGEAEHIRKAKTVHPYMGFMQFPDPVNRPARTIVATQLGRETLVLSTKEPAVFRRATVRECATIQTFPINFHFCGNSIGSRYRQAGDAVPPRLSFAIATEILKRRGRTEPIEPHIKFNGDAPAPALAAAGKRKMKLLPLDKRCRELVPGKEIRGCRVELDNEGSAPSRARLCGVRCLNIVQWVTRLHVGEGGHARDQVVVGLEDWIRLFQAIRTSARPSLLSLCANFADQITESLVGFVPDATTLQAAYSRRSEVDATPQSIVKLITVTVDKFFPKTDYGHQRILPIPHFDLLPKRGLLLRIAAGGLAAALACELANRDTRWLAENRARRYVPDGWAVDMVNCRDEAELIENPAKFLSPKAVNA